LKALGSGPLAQPRNAAPAKTTATKHRGMGFMLVARARGAKEAENSRPTFALP
jgi:hypothetical protein